MLRTVLVSLLLISFPAQAQESLHAYVGQYDGAGIATYPNGKTEPVSCRMSLEAGNAGKITIQKMRCQIAGVLMNLRGAIAHAGGNRYEAIISSNIGLSGSAVGRKIDNAIVFTISDPEIGDGSLALVADLALSSGMVLLDIDLISNLTGAVTEARIPLSSR